MSAHMARAIIPHPLNDWSALDETDSLWSQLDLSHPNHSFNFGIHRYNDRLWTSGYVGVGRLFDHRQMPLQAHGKAHIAVISSQHGLNPWKMLEAVMTDPEYESYTEELERRGRFLFRVFYEQPLVPLAQDDANDGDLLYALSFVVSCYFLCKKGLKKTMIRREENCNAKVRGKIDVKKNIRANTCRGRGDRFYCKYIDFTEDNIENRILKATLLKCRAIIDSRFALHAELARRTAFCMHAFRRVKTATIKISDFNSVSVSGLYMYYKPLLQQARCIFSQKYQSYTVGCRTVARSMYTIPYMINMETLFEFYARTVIKRSLDADRYELDAYSEQWYLSRIAAEGGGVEKDIHLMPYCIPDIVIRDRATGEALAVLDAKYKPHNRSMRSDSLQLLAYVLLTGVQRCGFVFPGPQTQIKPMKTSGTTFLPLKTPPVPNLKYFEILLDNHPDKTVLKHILP